MIESYDWMEPSGCTAATPEQHSKPGARKREYEHTTDEAERHRLMGITDAELSAVEHMRRGQLKRLMAKNAEDEASLRRRMELAMEERHTREERVQL